MTREAATNEIASCVNEAVGGTERVVENVARVSGAAKHCGVASSTVLSQSRELSRQTDDLMADITSFIAGIRTN